MIHKSQRVSWTRQVTAVASYLRLYPRCNGRRRARSDSSWWS